METFMHMQNAIHQSTVTRPSTPKVVPTMILTTSGKKDIRGVLSIQCYVTDAIKWLLKTFSLDDWAILPSPIIYNVDKIMQLR